MTSSENTKGSALAIPEQAQSLAQVNTICDTVEVWVQTVDSAEVIVDAVGKLAAMSAYLRTTSAEGRGRIESAARKCGIRLGEVTPKEPNGRGVKYPDSGSFISPQQRSKFRKMAANADLVDIIGSTDEDPLTQNKLLEAIKQREHDRLVDQAIRDMTPDDFDPVRNRELLRQRGALSATCKRFAELGDPLQFYNDNEEHLEQRHTDVATAGRDWLNNFLDIVERNR
jgi:hypothetical protein